MKKEIFLTIIISLILNMFVFAGGEKKNKTDDPFTQVFYQMIDSRLYYPEDVSGNQYYGFVLVSFQIDEAGAIEVLEMNYSSEEYRNAALQSLSGINLCSHATGKVYNMKFEYFQL